MAFRYVGGEALTELETKMQTSHPIHALRANLETARLELVQKIAADGALSTDALKQLATIQAALTAVREEIESHGPTMGFGAEKALE